MKELFDRMYRIDKLSLTGQRETHVNFSPYLKTYLNPVVLENLIKLLEDALDNGIHIGIYSGFRSFNHQLNIWNSKLLGNKIILDKLGLPINHSDYSQEEKIELLYKWVSIPSMSRHHWGTDIDIYESSFPITQNFTLLPADFINDGKFFKLYDWMKKHAFKYGFFMPYSNEPWHWSYKPLSDKFLAKLTVEMVIESIKDSEVLGKDYIFKNIDRLFNHAFVGHINSEYA